MLNTHLIPMFLHFCFIGPKRTTKKFKIAKRREFTTNSVCSRISFTTGKVKFYSYNIRASVTNSMSEYSGADLIKVICFAQPVFKDLNKDKKKSSLCSPQSMDEKLTIDTETNIETVFKKTDI